MKYWAIIGVVVLIIITALWAVSGRVVQAPGGQACTMEAKLCPDGSAVGRTGPNCEFAACPTIATTTTATTTIGGGGGGILPYNSGVRGTVLLGPTCPVERIPPDPACAEKPYATAIVVYHANSTMPFMLGNSDATGAFKFSLPPGDYTLKAGGTSMLPRCNQIDVTVAANGYATADISCDTGIR